MSPLAIKTLLDIWTCPGAVLNAEGINQLDYELPIIRYAGAGKKGDHGYEVTSRGEALIEKLCSIEPPKSRIVWEFEE